MLSRCTDHQQKDWWTKMFHLKVDIKTFIVSRQDNDRTKLHTGAGVVLPRNTFSPWFFPRCVRVLGRDPASGYQVPGRALRNWSHHPHSLYRADTWAPDPSVRHHSLTRQGSLSSQSSYRTCPSQHIWWPQVKQRSHFLKPFLISQDICDPSHVTPNCLVKSFQAVNGITQLNLNEDKIIKGLQGLKVIYFQHQPTNHNERNCPPPGRPVRQPDRSKVLGNHLRWAR